MQSACNLHFVRSRVRCSLTSCFDRDGGVAGRRGGDVPPIDSMIGLPATIGDPGVMRVTGRLVEDKQLEDLLIAPEGIGCC